MNCNEFDLAWVSDEDSQRAAAKEHAATCERCAEAVRLDREILQQAADWKQKGAKPRANLERWIAAELAAEGWIEEEAAKEPVGLPGRRSFWFWAAAAAAAAALIIGVALFTRPGILEPEVDTYEQAIAQVDHAQRSYVKAIADLERQADVILARSEDPTLSAHDAAILLNYRNRLTHLDSVIEEVQSFLDENPGHARGHTVLLAAYVEKDELLREIIQLSPGETS